MFQLGIFNYNDVISPSSVPLVEWRAKVAEHVLRHARDREVSLKRTERHIETIWEEKLIGTPRCS